MTTTTDTSAELLAQLTAGVEALTSGDDWARVLEVQAAFHDYSFGNCQLIVFQLPTATRVAGYKTWQALGRQVRKGEHGLRILAPMVGKDKDDPDGPRRFFGFKCVSVFDVSQTDGDDLPAVCHQLTGSAPAAMLDYLAKVAADLGVSIAFGDAGTSNGFYVPAERRIVIGAELEPAQQAKTLAHELGHAVLEHDYATIARPIAELEAESVAYVVSAALGLETSGYSFGYVATWAGDGETATAQIKRSGARIQKAAATILAKLEEVTS